MEQYNDFDNETIKTIYDADNTLRLSRNLDEKTMKARELICDVVNGILNKKESSNKKDIRDITIDEIEISSRTYNCLKRGNLKTLGDIIDTDYDRLCKIRNMGRKSVEEVIAIMKNYGYEMINGRFISNEEIDNQTNEEEKEINQEIITDIKDKKIEDLSMSTRLHTCLARTEKIKTFGDILSNNVMYYVKLRNLGNGCLKELLGIVHSYGYTLVGEEILNESNSEKSTFAATSAADIKESVMIEKITNQNEEQKRRLEEKKEKSKLLDEYIKLMLEQQKLNEIESKLDNEIKQKQEQLKKMGLKYEN